MLSKVKSVQNTGSFESEYGTPDANGKKLLYKFEYEMEDGTILTANHKTTTSPFSAGSEVDYEVTKTHPEHGKSGKVGKPDSGNYPNKAQGGGKVDSNIQAMIVKQNALGHATELLKHNAMMENKNFLSKDVMALAQIYADWVMKKEENATDALMNEEN